MEKVVSHFLGHDHYPVMIRVQNLRAIIIMYRLEWTRAKQMTHILQTLFSSVYSSKPCTFIHILLTFIHSGWAEKGHIGTDDKPLSESKNIPIHRRIYTAPKPNELICMPNIRYRPRHDNNILGQLVYITSVALAVVLCDSCTNDVYCYDIKKTKFDIHIQGSPVLITWHYVCAHETPVYICLMAETAAFKIKFLSLMLCLVLVWISQEILSVMLCDDEYVCKIGIHQGPLLLIWFNFYPNMDK